MENVKVQDSIDQAFILIDHLKSKLKAKESNREINKCWRKVEVTLQAISFETVTFTTKKTLYEEIQDLSEKFMNNEETEMARKTIRCEFNLIKLCFHDAKKRLELLDNLGISMHQIAQKEIGGQFTREYDFMDCILDEMHEISEADFQIKCQLITRFCISYGLCCIETGNYKKAIEINKKAIFLIQFVFGKNFKRNKYLNRCYQNIGIAYHRLGNSEEEKDAYAKADEFKKEYEDWDAEIKRYVPERIPTTPSPQRPLQAVEVTPKRERNFRSTNYFCN